MSDRPVLTALDIVRQIRSARYETDGEMIVQALIDACVGGQKAVELVLRSEEQLRSGISPSTLAYCGGCGAPKVELGNGRFICFDCEPRNL